MTITVEVPSPLSGQSTKELAGRARLLLVIDEVRAGRLTRAAAAQAHVDDFKQELDTIAADRH